MVNLKAKPFFLNDEDIKWVETTISSMTLEEKIGQLFIMMVKGEPHEVLQSYLDKYHIGGIRYYTAAAVDVYEQNKYLQENSKIPLLIAGNFGAGGNGGCYDGTYIANPAQVGATRSEKIAYNVGYVCGVEGSAIGCNWNFAPVVDILFNWRNTIVNTRAYGRDPDEIIRLSRAFIKGVSQSNVASCAKHFPGDGLEERDQHLVMGVDDISPEEWDKTFGLVYKTAIDEGLMSIMAGHIALPQYSRKLRPGITDDEIMPATLAPEIMTDLLRGQLGFNGLVVTDATHMLGMTSVMKRKDQVPYSIAAGCDMFLYFNDSDEDFKFMIDGYKEGILTEERLNDALYRILGMKAALNLHNLQKEGRLMPNIERLKKIGCPKFIEMADDAADQAITLVKDTQHQLPITPETHKRIKLVYLTGDIDNKPFTNEESQILEIESKRNIVIEELERVGFEVTLNQLDDNIGKISDLTDNFDAVFVFANVRGYARENTVRIKWSIAHSNEVPWYAAEIPTVFVSLNYTTHLHDVPMVKTYINSYFDSRTSIRHTIEKIIGKSEFKGVYDENVFCGKWDTRR